MSARDDLRLRHRSRSAGLAAAGASLIVASLVTRPRGLCGLVASPTVESGVLTLAGIFLLSAGIVALVIGSRRFRHHATAGHFSRGKRIPASSTCQRCSFPPVWGRVDRSITTSHSPPTRPRRSRPAPIQPALIQPALIWLALIWLAEPGTRRYLFATDDAPQPFDPCLDVALVAVLGGVVVGGRE